MTSSETSNQDLAFPIAAGHLLVSQVFFSPPNLCGEPVDMALYGWSLESTACFIGAAPFWRKTLGAVLAQPDSIFARNTVGKASESKLFQIPLRKG